MCCQRLQQLPRHETHLDAARAANLASTLPLGPREAIFSQGLRLEAQVLLCDKLPGWRLRFKNTSITCLDFATTPNMKVRTVTLGLTLEVEDVTSDASTLEEKLTLACNFNTHVKVRL